jgi:hypothetical protein
MGAKARTGLRHVSAYHEQPPEVDLPSSLADEDAQTQVDGTATSSIADPQ